jgi:hypothetical protein
MEEFRNSQVFLEREAPRLVEERRKAGLEGLVGDLACVILSVEAKSQRAAVEELQRHTGFRLCGVYDGPNYVTAVLQLAEEAAALSGATPPADILIRSRHRPGENPFLAMNDRPKSRHLPHTRLETLLFETFDLEAYVRLQRSRGVRFLTEEIVRTDTYSFIQTVPSERIGACYGFMEWHGGRRYSFAGGREVPWGLPAPAGAHRRDLGRLDHVATRLRARDRDEAILDFIRLTNHNFAFSIYVEGLNSITNVTRRSRHDVGLVFTSGIRPYISDEESGPTEKFVNNYGPRTHHLAFATGDIERTFGALRDDGQTFLIGLVGGPQEGLHQTFSNPSPHTLIVTEYIHRYGGFEGYFTLSNVTALTGATDRQ